MTDWIETERTRLRPFEEADAEEPFAWFSDPEVMKYIPRGFDLKLEDTRRRIAGYRDPPGVYHTLFAWLSITNSRSFQSLIRMRRTQSGISGSS